MNWRTGQWSHCESWSSFIMAQFRLTPLDQIFAGSSGKINNGIFI